MAMEKIFLSIQVIHAWRISKNKESRHSQQNKKIFEQKKEKNGMYSIEHIPYSIHSHR